MASHLCFVFTCRPSHGCVMTSTRTWGNKPRSVRWVRTTWRWCGGVQPSFPNTDRLQHGDRTVTHTVLYFCLVSRRSRWAAVLWISGSVWNTQYTQTHARTHSHNLALFQVWLHPLWWLYIKEVPLAACTEPNRAERNQTEVCEWKVDGMKILTAEEKRRPNRNTAGKHERLCEDVEQA